MDASRAYNASGRVSAIRKLGPKSRPPASQAATKKAQAKKETTSVQVEGTRWTRRVTPKAKQLAEEARKRKQAAAQTEAPIDAPAIPPISGDIPGQAVPITGVAAVETPVIPPVIAPVPDEEAVIPEEEETQEEGEQAADETEEEAEVEEEAAASSLPTPEEIGRMTKAELAKLVASPETGLAGMKIDFNNTRVLTIRELVIKQLYPEARE